ncbi:MAG: hypothetical protein ACRDVD_06825 [Acidimicrobiia bacterium]
MTVPDTPQVDYRVLTKGMATLLWIAGGLVFLAGLQLFVLTEQTDRFFAWTIDPPLTAAFLGASYWSSAVFEWSAARRHYWGDARIAVPAVFTFTVLTLVVSLIHLDKFHFGAEFETITQTVTWLWMAIYVTVPLVMAALWLGEQGTPGADPPTALRLPGWLRVLLGLHGIVLAAVGIALLVAPSSAMSMWPWTLTPLTARAIGAWLTSLAVVAVHSLWINSAHALRPAGWAYLTFGILQSVAVLRYPDEVAWTTTSGVAYLVFVATTVVIGAAIARYGRKPARSVTPP